MQNFCFLGNTDVIPLKAELYRNNYLWNKNTLRTSYEGSSHKDASDIWLRFNDLNDKEFILDSKNIINYPAFNILHQCRPLIFNLMRFVEGISLGRVIITRLPIGGKILPHIDEGKYHESYKRYHIFIQNYEGSIFRCGNEIICPKQGDIYLFDNKTEHELTNNSIDDKISLIIDIES